MVWTGEWAKRGRSAGDVGTLRAASRLRVMEVFLRHGPLARTDVAALADLSQATVSDVTAELIREGLLSERQVGRVAQSPAGRGRPRLLLDINAAAGHVVGIKLSTHRATLSITDFRGGPIASHSMELVAGRRSSAEAADYIADAVRALLADTGLALGDLAGIGLALPGFVDSLSGRASWSPIFGRNAPPFPGLLSRRLGLPIAAENDVNLVALAERWFGHGRDIDNFMVMTIEHGVGMGLYLNGALFRGPRGVAAEFGHVLHEVGGRPCRCGRRGCVEAYTADYALVSQAAEAEDRSPPQGADAVEAEIVRLTRLAEAGDPVCRALFAKAGQVLGLAVANLACVVTPERIIVTGAGVRAGELLMRPFITAFRQHALEFFRDTTSIVWHEWGDEVWARGAAVHILLERFAARRLSHNPPLAAGPVSDPLAPAAPFAPLPG
jgi:predicted NBD/HSP70 family sugar kinase